MNCNLTVTSGIKIKFGLRGFAATQVQRLGPAVDVDSEGSTNLWQTFPKTSGTKMKGRVFFGSQIKQLFEDNFFSTKSNATESLGGI
jgi:hypothetical protein